MKYQSLKHRFVRTFPESLEPGVLYISIQYASVAHLCCCGCGEEVATPLSPTDWKIIFDGKTVSLSPSVGSWTLPCRSHYIISQNRVTESAPWTEEQIERGRRRERLAKERYYGRATPTSSVPDNHKRSREKNKWNWLSKLWRLLTGHIR